MKSWLWLILLLPLAIQVKGKPLVAETFDGTTQSYGGVKVLWTSTGKDNLEGNFDPVLGKKAFKCNKVVGILPFDALNNPGDTITVNFSFRLAGPIATTDHGFKVGLFEGGDRNDPWFFAAGTGYRWNISTGPYPLPISVVKESGGPGQKVLSGQDSNVLGQSSASYSLNDTAKHTATITMVNNSGTINLTLAIDGTKLVFKSSDLLPPSTLAPTRLAIRSDANTFLFDDFTLDIKAGN